MGVFIYIEGWYPCPNCNKPLDGWQSKRLSYDGYPVDGVTQAYKLNKKMSGEIHSTCPTCGSVEYEIKKGSVAKVVNATP
jgi:ssDNA-binding Zn-finger/Zn-ribbon topoisomerase 1